MLTDSKKLDKILENQELIIKIADNNCAILNVFLDMATAFTAHYQGKDFDAAKSIVIARVGEYKDLIKAKRAESKSENPEDSTQG